VGVRGGGGGCGGGGGGGVGYSLNTRVYGRMWCLVSVHVTGKDIFIFYWGIAVDGLLHVTLC
jgi:hypothetical protein